MRRRSPLPNRMPASRLATDEDVEGGRRSASVDLAVLKPLCPAWRHFFFLVEDDGEETIMTPIVGDMRDVPRGRKSWLYRGVDPQKRVIDVRVFEGEGGES